MYKCIDGTCQQDPLDCPPTLREYPVVSSTVTQTCHPKQQEIHLSSYKGRSVAKIFFPSGVLGTCSPSTIGFKSVSLSNLMQVRNPIDETRLNEFKNNITELPFGCALLAVQASHTRHCRQAIHQPIFKDMSFGVPLAHHIC